MKNECTLSALPHSLEGAASENGACITITKAHSILLGFNFRQVNDLVDVGNTICHHLKTHEEGDEHSAYT